MTEYTKFYIKIIIAPIIIISIICWYKNCKNLTASKYGLCTKHYKLQWQRIKNKLIGNIYEDKIK